MAPRTIVVAGASSGIGQATAMAFATGDNCIVVHGNRNVEGVRKTASYIRDQGCEAFELLADVSTNQGIHELVSKSFAWKGRVDAWIHAAGADVLTGDAKLLSFEEKLNRLWQTDVLGTILTCRDVADRMQRQPVRDGLPSISTIAWDQAEHGMEGDSGQYFAATKSAISAFSRSLAKTVGPQVRVNCVAPGWIKTSWGETTSSDWDARARGESCLNRWGKATDVAAALVSLADTAMEFINGQTIHVNGGWKPS